MTPILRRTFSPCSRWRGRGPCPEEEGGGCSRWPAPRRIPRPESESSSPASNRREDHDGTKIPGLSDPQTPGADLTAAQLDAMVRKAIDVAARRTAEFYEVVEPEDWFVILTRARTDSRIVASVLGYLAEHERGLRFTIADRLPQGGDWGEDHRKLVGNLAARFPKVRFELVDLKTAPTVDLPVADRPSVRYTIPKIVQQCDRLISIAPLSTDPATGVSLSIGNYAAISPQTTVSDETLIDLFSYRPADLALVGGCLGLRKGRQPRSPQRPDLRHEGGGRGCGGGGRDGVQAGGPAVSGSRGEKRLRLLEHRRDLDPRERNRGSAAGI